MWCLLIFILRLRLHGPNININSNISVLLLDRLPHCKPLSCHSSNMLRELAANWSQLMRNNTILFKYASSNDNRWDVLFWQVLMMTKHSVHTCIYINFGTFSSYDNDQRRMKRTQVSVNMNWLIIYNTRLFTARSKTVVMAQWDPNSSLPNTSLIMKPTHHAV